MDRPVRNRRQELRRIRLLFFATTLGRLVTLLGVVVGSGLIAGLALGLPLNLAARGSEDVPDLDHAELAGTIEAEEAAPTVDDLPGTTWAAATADVSAFSIFDEEWCGTSVSTERLSPPVTVSFNQPGTDAYVIGEVATASSRQSADQYVDQISNALTACEEFTAEDGSRIIIDDEDRDPPVSHFISRSMRTEDSSQRRIVTYFQVGDLVVALQYLGHTQEVELMEELEGNLLARLAPDVFGDEEGELQLDELPDDIIDSPTETSLVEGGAADETEDTAQTTETTTSTPPASSDSDGAVAPTEG